VTLPGEVVGDTEKGPCSRCGEEFERRLLERCPWCFKDFCRTCRFPGGVVGYCSRVCAEAMFYGGDSEEGAEEG
jgi:hypothetical protein